MKQVKISYEWWVALVEIDDIPETYQYMEDQLSVLDLAKEVGGIYVNPFAAAGFTPSAWSPSRGAFKVKSGLWGDSRLAKGIRSVPKAVVKKFSGKSGDVLRRHAKRKLGGLSNKMPKSGFLSSMGMQYKDGYLGISDTRLKDTVIQRKLNIQIQKGKQLLKQNDATAINRRIQKMQPKLMGATTEEALMKASNQIYKETGKLTATKESLTNWGTRSVRGRGNIAGGYIGKVAHGGSRALMRGGVRAGMLIGKASAVVAVGSLMWEGAKMIGNPIGAAAANAVNNTFDSLQSFANPELGGKLNMDFISQGAATERQRAVQAISKSRINGRSMMGNEAQYMHA